MHHVVDDISRIVVRGRANGLTAPPLIDPDVDDALLDPDGDGLLNLGEMLTSAEPCHPDSDLDGYNDNVEAFLGTDPIDDCPDNAADPAYLKTARALVKAAHGDEAPLVVDPFAGGGSIPLEALRIGCDAFASDLNPVACLILKVLLEDIPRHGPQLADELRRVGAEIKKQAEKELAEFYPPDPDGARPIAYLWARTVRCEQPNCGCEIPLVRSMWLATKSHRRRALRLTAPRSRQSAPQVCLEVFTPSRGEDVASGTISRAKATCPACQRVLDPNRMREQLREQSGGADVRLNSQDERVGGATLLAVVKSQEGESGRDYRSATPADYRNVWKAGRKLRRLSAELASVPDEPVPLMSGTFNAPIYGMSEWGLLFSQRQKLLLLTLVHVLRRMKELNPAIRELAAIDVSRLADISNALCSWKPSMSQVIHVFTRQALPMMWDFAEADPLSDQAGDYSVTLGNLARILEKADSIAKI